MQALVLAQPDSLESRIAACGGAGWLQSAQLATGGWEYYATGTEYPLIDAEVMLAVYLAQTPEGCEASSAPESTATDGVQQLTLALTSTSSVNVPPPAQPFAL